MCANLEKMNSKIDNYSCREGAHSIIEGYQKVCNIPIERNINSIKEGYVKNVHHSYREKTFHKQGVPKNVYYFYRGEKHFIRGGTAQHKTITISLKKRKILQERELKTAIILIEKLEKSIKQGEIHLNSNPKLIVVYKFFKCSAESVHTIQT